MNNNHAQNHQTNSRVLALTMGDPAGIGIELTLMAWTERVKRDLPAFVLYADANTIQTRAQDLGLTIPISRIASPAIARSLFRDSLPIIDNPLASKASAGKPNSANGPAIIKSIDQAVTDTMDGLASAVVTNPISKAVLYDAGFKYPGHTEYLAYLAGQFGPADQSKPVMMLACDALRVVPLTIHIPLRDVPKNITPELIIKTALTTHEALKRDFALPQPRLAITGLNPHAGENGALGSEDDEIIKPAIDHLKTLGINVTGPHAADTLFHQSARKTYDAVIAMYHDQALIPIKTLAFDSGVNVTLGLPFVRTSPDHGTAFDIAGTGTGSTESLVASLKMADLIAGRRFKAQQHGAKTPK